MQRPQLIKSFVQALCPKCAQPIHVVISFLPPGLSYLLSDEEMQANKRRLKEALKLVEFKDKKAKDDVMAEVDGEDFVFGAEDLDDLVKSISKEQKE